MNQENIDPKQLEIALLRYKQLLKARYARQSFYLFSKYIIGYNGRPNDLIVPHAHGELCHLTQYTLTEVQDVGGERLGEGKGTCYDTFTRYQQPPTQPEPRGSD